MGTVAIAPLPTSGDLVTEKTTYRAYVTFKPDGTIDKKVAKAEVKDQANWKKLEAEGHTQLNENSFTRYTIKSMEAFSLIVPDEAQRVYIAQAGLNYLQNSKANALSVELKEGTDTTQVQAEPLYNNEEIDLRDAINEPPERKYRSPIEKAISALKASGLSADVLQELVAQIAAQQAAAAQAATQAQEAEQDV